MATANSSKRKADIVVDSVTSTGEVTGSNLNVSNWDTAYGWGNHANAGYLTSLPSHNHDTLYYTKTQADSRYVNTSGDTISGLLLFSQNPVGTTYGDGVSATPPSRIQQLTGDNDGWRLYGESPASNDVKMVFEIIDDIETGDTWVFRNKKTYGDYLATEPFKIQGNGNIIATGTITASGYNKSNWDTAYGWGNHSTQNYAVTTGDTFTGELALNGSSSALTFRENPQGASYTPQEGGVRNTRYFLRFDYTNNDSFPYLCNRTPNGRVGLYSGGTNAGVDVERIRILGGDGTKQVQFHNSEIAIGSSTVIDSARNLTNIGTISTSGSISVSGYNSVSAFSGSFSYLTGALTGNVTGNLTGNADTATKWQNARTITLGGDLTGSVSLDGSSNVTLSAQVINDSHTHDGRYYTESEIQTFMNRGYISGHGASNLAVGWYTIATNTGDRASARFGIWDGNSGDHQSVTFYASHHFGTDSSNTLTVLDNSYYSGNPFRYIRIKDAGTYDGAALQIYIDDASNSVSCAILGDNFQSSGWVLCDWIPDATTPPSVSNYANFGERSRVDLNQIAQGGLATTGEIYAGGDTTLQRVFHDAYHPNADKWTTARNNNINLTGDVTGYGSASVDGTGNWTVTVNTTVRQPAVGNWFNNGHPLVGGDGVMEIGRYIDFHNSDTTTSDYTARITNTGSALYASGQLYADGNQRVFADNYHPNADKWTTARTLSLTGDVTGSVSWDGSANASITATVANDSHNHDHSDGRFTVGEELRMSASGNIRSDSEFQFLTIAGNAQTMQTGGIGVGASYSTYPAFTGGVNVQNGYQVNGTTVIDSSRNLTNIASITTGTIEMNQTSTSGFFGSASFSWEGNSTYPTLYGESADRWVMICFPHIPYLNSGQRGYTGATLGSLTRYEAWNDNHYDAGVLSRIGDGRFSISRYNLSTPSITAYSANATQHNVNIGGTNSPWNNANRSTLTINGQNNSLLGFTYNGGNSGYVYGYGSTMEMLAYGELKLLSNASGSYYGKLNTGVWNVSHGYQVAGTTVIDSSRNISGVNLSLSGQATIWTNSDNALVLRQGQSGHPWNYIEFRNSTNDRNWYTGTDASGNYVIQGETGATGVYTNKRLTAEALTSKAKTYIDSDHGSTRLQLKYRHNGVEEDGNSGHLTLWTSEPGITYDNCGIGGNVNVSGQYYGRQINANPYGVYLRFDVNSGFSEFWSTTGSAGTAGGQGGRRWFVDHNGNTSQTGDVTCDDVITNRVIDKADGSTWLELRGDGGGLRSQTANGYIDIGSMNSGWGHISTDRPSFYFNKKITVDEGIIQSYNEDLILRRALSSSNQMTLNTSGATFTGNVTAYSDVTLKDNITEIDNALEKVNSIRGVTYDRIDQDNARHAGVIAQEVEEVLPEVVHTDDNGIKSVAYGNMVGLLIEAIKEQQAQINELKEELKNVNSN